MVQYDEKLNAEINRTFYNFNRKVKRNKTKTRGKGMLPQIVDVRNWKDKYSDKSRREIEKQLKIYQSFGKRDALNKPTESRVSKWELKYFKANRNKTIEFYDREIADYTRIIGDQPQYHLRLNSRLNDLIEQRKALLKPLESLTEDEIKSLRAYYNYAERSELVKRQGFNLYFSQLERAMKNLNYSKEEIEKLFSKFYVLSENEFTEMVRNEDLIDDIYTLVHSPKGRGVYELMIDEEDAKSVVEDLINHADELIAKYKTSK